MIRYACFFVGVLVWMSGLTCVAQGQNVSVRVFSGQTIERAVFEATGTGSLVISGADESIAELSAGESATVEVWQGLLRVRWSRGSAPMGHVSLAGSGPIRVTPDGLGSRLYRGSFHASLDDGSRPELLLVNTLDIEDYVASVLPAEYPFTEVEGAKAQAIVIRSYAVAAGQNGTSPYSLRDDIGSQVYRGADTETEFSRRIARLTKGSVLLHDGKVVEAVYSSHCGGHSANNEDIWGTTPVPYLRGRKDPYDRHAPGAEWRSEAGVNDVHESLSHVLGKRVEGLKVTDRGKGDHVRTVEISIDDGPDETVSGERFRSMLNASLGEPLILSSKFEIRKGSGDYHFEGRGSGHGVGFCQWGAAEQARQGRDHEEILTFYYRDVDISEPDVEVLALADEDATGHQPDDATTAHPAPDKRIRARRPGW